jgi:hypothetical protein
MQNVELNFSRDEFAVRLAKVRSKMNAAASRITKSSTQRITV